MKKRKDMVNGIQIYKIFFIIPLLFFVFVIFQMTRLSISSTIDGVNLKNFASNRNTKKEVLYANRGTIYTSDGDILAQNVNSYTVIAYLSSKRSVGYKNPQHVVDKVTTAAALAPLLELEQGVILKLLSKEKLYQIEIKKGISEIKKEEIEALKLSGIDFIKSYKRYYPNNNFLSYDLGYVQTNEKGTMTGEMGIEKFYNKELSGRDGYLEYQKDVNGYKIPNTPEVKSKQKNGDDVYLTIDENIQMFTEQVIKEVSQKYNPEWMLAVVVDAKTGAILGNASTPSFDPNIKDITNYMNPLVSYTYEPGSTMKSFTYMAALEKGTYKGSDTFLSGKIVIDDATISDWNVKGWGTITYDQGFALSSNVGVSNLVANYLTKEYMKTYFTKLGFGQKTGITLSNEALGTINFKYKVEVANAGFGQGITVTPIQMIQALSAIANDGVMLKPYIVDKIVNPDNNEIVYQGGRSEVATVASKATTDRIKELMDDVVNGTDGLPATQTGSNYKIAGYDIIGKTGTAQYVNSKTGEYASGPLDYIKSFIGIFPKDDPQIMIYVVVKRPLTNSTSQALSIPTVKLISNIAKYLNIYSKIKTNGVANPIFKVPNLINKSTSSLGSLSHTSIIIGDGTKIINQYPSPLKVINETDKFFVLTNGKNINVSNMTGWSSREVKSYCKLINIACNFTGSGYVTTQDVVGGTLLNDIKIINFVLEKKSIDKAI